LVHGEPRAAARQPEEKLMLQNTAVDVAIGLILMYLMLSLLCTTVNEFISTKLGLRSKGLESTLKTLLDNADLQTDFYNHGLIVGSKRATSTGTQSSTEVVTNVTGAIGITSPTTKEDHPSYLSGRTVALALMGVLNKDKTKPVIDDIKNSLTALQGTKIHDILESSLLEAQGDIDKLRTSLSAWFDDSMDRLSGAYKRQIKWISMLVGLVVAIVFNADSVKVATTLWNDPGSRAAAVEMATTVAKQPPRAADGKVDDAKLKEEIAKTENTLRSLPIGWHCEMPKPAGGATSQAAGSVTTSEQKANPTTQMKDVARWECIKQNWSDISLVQFLGWLLTGAALSLGAPFWFDLLNKFINLRGAGAKPAREDGKKPA
jgi:hypothetical protein